MFMGRGHFLERGAFEQGYTVCEINTKTPHISVLVCWYVKSTQKHHISVCWFAVIPGQDEAAEAVGRREGAARACRPEQEAQQRRDRHGGQGR